MIYRKSKLSNFLSIEKSDIKKNISKETNNSFINEKSCYNKISNIFNCILEDLFPKIISSKSKESFINEIKEKSMKIIHNNYNNNEIQLPIINNIISKVKDEIKNKINKIHSFLENYLEDIETKRKNICYVTLFRKHCIKSENTAYHLCDNGKLGNFIKIESNFANEKDFNYIICQSCFYNALGRNIPPEVDHPVSVIFKDDLDDVLAYIVYVSLNRRDYDALLGGIACRYGLSDLVKGHFCGFRTHEELRQEHCLFFKAHADHIKRRHYLFIYKSQPVSFIITRKGLSCKITGFILKAFYNGVHKAIDPLVFSASGIIILLCKSFFHPA